MSLGRKPKRLLATVRGIRHTPTRRAFVTHEESPVAPYGAHKQREGVFQVFFGRITVEMVGLDSEKNGLVGMKMKEVRAVLASLNDHAPAPACPARP